MYHSTDGIFDIYFEQYVVQLEKKIKKIHNSQILCKREGKRPTCVNKIIDDILAEIASVAAFSLIDYYTSEKAKNKSITYKAFNESFTDKEFLEKFDAQYPMVKKLCTQIINNYIGRIEEVLATIFDYRSEIVDFIGNNTEMDISEIDISKGDYHENTFVAIITINKQKLVLKKRFNIGERILNILKNVYKAELVELPIIRTRILSDQLVIQEFIEPATTFNREELNRYYNKFGLMAGIFSILGSKDLHNENVIATKKGPYFIDMEAAITPRIRAKTYSLLKETLLFNCSEMGLVYGNSDLSAFTGKAEAIQCVEIKNRGMDDIYIGMQEKTPILMNMPRNEEGENVEPFEYISEVKAGYNQAISIFMKCRDKIVDLLSGLTGYDNRVVLRNTGFYATYLFNLCLPSYMKSQEEYEKLLLLLSKKSIRDEEIISEEINCLRKHIIPYFTISRFVPENEVKEEFLNRLKELNSDVLEREKHYLNMALNIEELDVSQSFESCNSEERIFKEMSKYKRLCFFDETLKYGVKDLTIQNKILDYRNDLYTFGGALLFLSKVCPEMKESVKKTVENNSERKIISGLNGYHAGILLEKYLGVYNHAKYEQADALITESDDVDFSTYGSSILVLDYLYRKTSQEQYLNDISFYGEIYLKKAKEQKFTGLLHGYSGDALVMGVLRKYFPKEDMYERIEECIKREDKFYDETCKNWLDTREEMEEDRDMSAISYGAVGITLSRMLLCMDESIPQNIKTMCTEDIKKGINKIISTPREMYADDSLINGYAGALTVLKIAKTLGYGACDKLQDATELYLRNGEKCLSEDVWRYGKQTHIYNPAFASGRIGTIFALWYISGNRVLMATE